MMKSLAQRAASRLAVTFAAALLGVYCSAAAVAAAPAAPARPGAGGGFTVSLAASASYPLAGQSVTLTASTNADVGPTPYYITIYSETTGAELAVCGAGTTCSVAVTKSTPGTQAFEAFVGDDVASAGHPGFTLVSSNEVPVTWWLLILRCPACTAR